MKALFPFQNATKRKKNCYTYGCKVKQTSWLGIHILLAIPPCAMTVTLEVLDHVGEAILQLLFLPKLTQFLEALTWGETAVHESHLTSPYIIPASPW